MTDRQNETAVDELYASVSLESKSREGRGRKLFQLFFYERGSFPDMISNDQISYSVIVISLTE